MEQARPAQAKVETLPHIAVLLSTYNGALYLCEQLESLRVQQGVTLHLHVRDDGSNDETCAILRDHSKIWPELAGIGSGPNMRPTGSFMHLLRTAPEADYYAFCDQDDVWLPNKLARAVEAIAQESGPALYCANMRLADEQLDDICVARAHDDLSFEHLLFENFATGCTILMNAKARDLLKQVTPDDRAIIMHDWWCALVLAALGHVHYDHEPMILYRQHRGNVVGQASSPLMQNIQMARRAIRERKSFYPIHKQASEFLRLYGAHLSPERRRHIGRFVQSRQSAFGRMRYALTGPVVRRDALSALVVRGLIMADWY